MCFSRRCLTISKYCAIITIHNTFENIKIYYNISSVITFQYWNRHFLKYMLLLSVLCENPIKCKFMLFFFSNYLFINIFIFIINNNNIYLLLPHLFLYHRLYSHSIHLLVPFQVCLKDGNGRLL